MSSSAMTDDRPPSAVNPELVQLHDVSKVYVMGDVEVHALRKVSLTIRQGDFVAVMGASGSGKSTLMNIVGCLDRPTAGDYHLAGQSVAGLSAPDLAQIRNKVIGFVFQNFNLLTRTTAVDNVELPLTYTDTPARERHARATEALERVGLGDRMHHFTNQMSGGQMQRVAIARALVTKPRLILADEPTGNLDSRTSVEIMALFQELGRAGMTIVLVTHEPDISGYAARVLVMKDGRIRSDTRQTPREAVVGPAEIEEADA